MADHQKITCLAVDDEPPAHSILQKHIALIPTLELVATCHNAMEALSVPSTTGNYFTFFAKIFLFAERILS